MPTYKTGYARQPMQSGMMSLYGYTQWQRGDKLHYEVAHNQEEGGYFVWNAKHDVDHNEKLAVYIRGDEDIAQWISDEPLPQYPVIFRRLKENGSIDIWFPTDLSHVRDNVYYVTVATQYEGHTAGTREAMLEISESIRPSHPDVQDVKERYERAHDVVLIPYVRWQRKFTEALDKQYKEWVNGK